MDNRGIPKGGFGRPQSYLRPRSAANAFVRPTSHSPRKTQTRMLSLESRAENKDHSGGKTEIHNKVSSSIGFLQTVIHGSIQLSKIFPEIPQDASFKFLPMASASYHGSQVEPLAVQREFMAFVAHYCTESDACRERLERFRQSYSTYSSIAGNCLLLMLYNFETVSELSFLMNDEFSQNLQEAIEKTSQISNILQKSIMQLVANGFLGRLHDSVFNILIDMLGQVS